METVKQLAEHDNHRYKDYMLSEYKDTNSLEVERLLYEDEIRAVIVKSNGNVQAYHKPKFVKLPNWDKEEVEEVEEVKEVEKAKVTKPKKKATKKGITWDQILSEATAKNP